MPDIKDYAEGDYARVGFSLKEGTVVEFMTEGEFIKVQFGNKERERFIISGRINGHTKGLTLNQKSLRNLGEEWGTHTKDWIGKKARVHIEEKNVFGELKKVVYYQPLKEDSPKATNDEEADYEAAEIADYLKQAKNMQDLNGKLLEMRSHIKKLPKKLQEWVNTEVESKREDLR